jgi:hypothetical protein
MFVVDISSWALPFAFEAEKEWVVSSQVKSYKLSFLCFHLTVIRA